MKGVSFSVTWAIRLMPPMIISARITAKTNPVM